MIATETYDCHSPTLYSYNLAPSQMLRSFLKNSPFTNKGNEKIHLYEKKIGALCQLLKRVVFWHLIEKALISWK